MKKLSAEERKKLLNEFKEITQSGIEFSVKRTNTEDRSLTFSREAMNHLMTMLELWVGAKILAKAEAKEVPQSMKVEINVIFEDISLKPGQHRSEGVKS